MSFCSGNRRRAVFSTSPSRCFFIHSLLLLFLLILPTYTESQKQQKRQKPNIVILFADDVGQGDVPGYWDEGDIVDMPNLQDIIDHGVVFTDAHSTPICAPSRYVLLSGRYQHQARNAGGTWSLGNYGAFDKGQKSIANVLQERGNYHTAAFGKWHLGGKIQPNGEQISKTKVGYLSTSTDKHNWKLPIGEGPNELGFDSSYITPGGIQSPPYSFFRNGILDTKQEDIRYWEVGEYEIQSSNGDVSNIHRYNGEGHKEWNSAGYNQRLVQETEAFLDDHSQGPRSNDPFFIYTAFGSVHIPHSPPNYYNDTKVKNKYPTRHQDLLYEMDLAVGSILAALEQRNLLENTIIIFTSDNGGLGIGHSGHGSSSGPLRGHKGSLFEGGHRVPFFVRYDGVFPAGERRHQLIGLNDIYATLLDLADINIPKDQNLQSMSFQEQIFSEDVEGRTSLAVWRVSRGTMRGAMIRRGNLKLVMQTDSYERFYLFDLETDLFEEHDLSYHRQYTSTMKDMMKQLEKIGPCPRDKWESFRIPKPHVGTEVWCNYFQKDPQKCFKFQKTAERNCPYTCSPYFNLKKHKMCKDTKLYPPRKICQDSNKEFYMNGGIRDCNYVKSKKNDLCDKFVAEHMCPGTCKACS